MSEVSADNTEEATITSSEATHGQAIADSNERVPDIDDSSVDQNDIVASGIIDDDDSVQPISDARDQEANTSFETAANKSPPIPDADAVDSSHGSNQSAEHVEKPSADSTTHELAHDTAVETTAVAVDTNPSPSPVDTADDASAAIDPVSETTRETARSPSPSQTQKDAPTQIDYDDDDDDYDPESVFSTPVPSQPPSALQTQSESFLKSVLDEVKKPEPKPQSGQPVDLSKLLSSMGAIKPASSTNNTANTPSAQRPDIDAPFTAEETADYEQFLATEAEYIKTGRWDQFPYGSRMFVGNLPVTKITKAQLFKLFRTYGRMAQISIKQAYGFIQYFDPDNCKRAMETESKEPLKGSTLHLEISKPQIPKRERERQREQERQKRDHEKERDRSRSPRRRNRKGGRNNRQRSPMRSGSNSMPMGQRRQGSYVPECPIFVLEHLDGQFVQYVENELNGAGIRVAAEDVRPNAAQNMIRQAAFDGAIAVISLNMKNQNRGSVDIQIFDRSSSSMRFDEYLDVQTHVAVELINRAKRQAASAPPSLPPVPRYGQQQPHQQQQQQHHLHNQAPLLPAAQYQAQPPQQYGGANASTSNLLGTLQQMDPSALQSMMQYIQSQNHQQPQPQPPQPSYVPPQGQYGQQSYGYGGYNAPNPGSMPPAANASQSTQQVQDIMEQLAQLQKRQ